MKEQAGKWIREGNKIIILSNNYEKLTSFNILPQNS